MIFSRKPPLIVGLDIGTSAIKIAVGERRADGGLSLMGSHRVESRGVRKGEVVHHAEASACIMQAVQEAEEALNMEIGEIELALTGGHIDSANQRGTATVSSETHEISEEDVEEAVTNARAGVLLADGKVVLHVVRQQFYIDGKDGVANPVGLLGSRLEADAHCIYGIGTRFQNTLNCLHERRETSVDVNNWVFSGLASSLAILDRHDKELGSIVLDIGAGTTDYVVYAKGMIRQTGVLAIGGDHLTNDLLLGLKLQSRRRAEAIIREHGSVWLDPTVRGKTVKVKTSDLLADRERTFQLEHIHVVLNARMDEMLRIIRDRVFSQGLNDLVGAGVFLTGGCARLPGLVELTQSIFEMPATLAAPQGFDGQVEQFAEPEMSTVVGLVKYGQIKRGEAHSQRGIGAYVRRFLGMAG